MRVLLIKTSSLGDIIHTFPAITDAVRHHPNLRFDWVAEESFAKIPLLHPHVNQTFPIAFRRWRKNLWRPSTWKEMYQAFQQLHQGNYDLILDAQGLLKSSLLSLCTVGKRYGYAWHGAREPIASLFYHHKFEVTWDGLSAINRTRTLFAKTFGYPVPETPPDPHLIRHTASNEKAILFLPGTTWLTKKWPTEHWIELAQLIKPLDIPISIPWSTEEEYQEALQIQTAGSHVQVLDKMPLNQLANVIQQHCLTISGDSGIGYLSAAFQIPTFILWGPTTPKRIGRISSFQHDLISSIECSPCQKRWCRNKHLSPIQPPCLTTITPKMVFDSMKQHISQSI